MAENQREERVNVDCYGYLCFCYFCFVTVSSSAEKGKKLDKLLSAKAEYLQAAVSHVFRGHSRKD